MEFTLLGASAVAVAMMYAVLWYEGGRTNAADCTRDVWDALIAAAVAGLVVGRLAAMVAAGANPISHPGDILIVRGGVDTVAATITGIAVFALVVRRDLWWMADAAAPAAVAAAAGWHLGCLVRNACLGTASDLPWAVAQKGSTITRHPVEIYAALLLVVGVMLLIAWKHRRPHAGTIAAVGLAWAAAVRLATEPMRVGLGTDLTWAYAAGTILALAVVYWRRRSRAAAGRP